MTPETEACTKVLVTLTTCILFFLQVKYCPVCERMNKKFTTECTELHPDLKNQIAALLCTTEDAIQVKYMDTQMQSGSNDCGIFVIAFASALANGEHPRTYQLDQPKMQKHLIDSLEVQLSSTFPVKRTRRADKYKVLSTIPVYCSCRMPEQAGCTMIRCCTCKEWYHIGACVTVGPEALDSATKWFCSRCTYK